MLPMKTRGFACVFLFSVAIVLPYGGYAQQRGTVGVSLTLKPIQTIQVDLNEKIGGTTAQSGASVGSPSGPERVRGFGTSAYDVSVDHITSGEYR